MSLMPTNIARQLIRRLLLVYAVCGFITSSMAQQDSQAPLYTLEDMQFLSDMIMHHQQAVDMSALVHERIDAGSFPDFQFFSQEVARGQASEIHMMESLLALAENRGQTVPMRHMHEGHTMTGMLTPEQMDTLAANEGKAFVKLWLQGMIYHHQGAIDMAATQQQHQLETGRRPYGMDVLVEEIIVVQRAEIHLMQQWLEVWELSE